MYNKILWGGQKHSASSAVWKHFVSHILIAGFALACLLFATACPAGANGKNTPIVVPTIPTQKIQQSDISTLDLSEITDAYKIELAGTWNESDATNTLTALSTKIRAAGEGAKIELDMSSLSGLTKLENKPFKAVKKLSSLTLAEGVTKINAYEFDDCANLEKLYIPKSVEIIDSSNSVFGRCKKLSIIVHKENRIFSTDAKGVLYEAEHASSENRTYYLRWVPEKLMGTYEISSSTKRINEYALCYSNLTKLVIPSSVNHIEGHNFHYVKIPLAIETNWSAGEVASLIFEGSNMNDDGDWTKQFYFNGVDCNEITVSVAKGTKAAYESPNKAAWLWQIAKEYPESSGDITTPKLVERE